VAGERPSGLSGRLTTVEVTAIDVRLSTAAVLLRALGAHRRRSRYLPMQAEAAAALFQVVSRRYLKGSIILTTNRSISS
jgi:hypothetical protein